MSMSFEDKNVKYKLYFNIIIVNIYITQYRDIYNIILIYSLDLSEL